VHLVCLGLEPLEESPDTVVPRVPLQNGPFLLIREFAEGEVHGDPFLPAEILQVLVFHPILASPSPWPDGPLVQGKRGVRDDEIRVYLEHSAEAPAGVACAYGAVEREKTGKRRSVGNPAGGALQPAAEDHMAFGAYPQVHPASPETKSLFEGIHDSFTIGISEEEPVRYYMDLFSGGLAFPFIQGDDPPLPEDAGKPHPAKFFLHVRRSGLLGFRREGDHDFRALRDLLHGRPDGLGGLGYDRISALPAVKHACPRKEQFHVIRDLGHGAHRGSGGSDRVFAVNGNGRRDIFDPLHLRPVHAIHELPGIRGKGLYVSSLPLCVEGVECERGFA